MNKEIIEIFVIRHSNCKTLFQAQKYYCSLQFLTIIYLADIVSFKFFDAIFFRKMINTYFQSMKYISIWFRKITIYTYYSRLARIYWHEYSFGKGNWIPTFNTVILPVITIFQHKQRNFACKKDDNYIFNEICWCYVTLKRPFYLLLQYKYHSSLSLLDSI